MKKINLVGASALLTVSAVTAYAQDAGTDTETAEVETVESGKPMEPTAGGNGAQVLREQGDILEQATDPATGEPLVDETTGEPVMNVVGSQYTQTVTTPSGNVNTLIKTTDLDGNTTTTVEHYRPEKAERIARAERAERPEKPEKPERPEKPEHAGRP